MLIYHIFLEKKLQSIWSKRQLLACLLWPISLIFGLLVQIRKYLYFIGFKKTIHLPVPVIIIGNIFIGGTGKTPFTIFLIHILRVAGFYPAVISRGYGITHKKVIIVTKKSHVKEVGDEPLLIIERTGCPVVVGKNRVMAGKKLLSMYPDVNVIISDDGLQHYALARDIEIVVCDVRGNGNGWLLPAGPLREPASRYRDFTIYNSNIINNNVPTNIIYMKLISQHIEQLHNRKNFQFLSKLITLSGIVAIAGIGNPQRFFTMLYEVGLNFKAISLPDHYNFYKNPFAMLTAKLILITEKDAIKCQSITIIKNDFRIWVVPVSAYVDDVFTKQIVEKLREH